MANKILNVKILHRADTAANWAAANPVLSSAEFGIEKDTNKFKIGDGVTAWNSLVYFAGGAVAITAVSGDLQYNSGTGVLSYVGPSVATQSVAGLLSAADKAKLDGIAAGAEVNILTGVKVNGVLQTLTAKVVDILIPTTPGDIGAAPASHTQATSTITGLDTALAGKLPLAGGNMTGAMQVLAPTADMHPATKKYVDDNKAQKATTLSGYGIADAYTKTEVDSIKTTLEGKISGALHFKGVVADMTALNALSDMANGDVYQVTATGAEHVYVTGTGWIELGTVVDLSAYATQSWVGSNYVAKDGSKVLTTNDLTNALKSNYDAAYSHSQAAHAPSGAQVNVLEGIQLAGTDVSVASKKSNIPIATNGAFGVVKSSSANNQVAVNGTTGVMSLNGVTTDILVQGIDTLILNGGTAS